MVGMATAGVGLSAQSLPATVEGIAFRLESTLSGREPWLEIAITIATGAPDRLADPATRHFNKVQVQLSLATEAASVPDPKPVRYYRAQCTAASLEARAKKVFYFYLPPEIVKRDRLKRDPLGALVEIAINGQTLPWRKENVAGAITDAARLKSFLARCDSESTVNDGVLLPIFQTPFFSSDYPEKTDNGPSYMRAPEIVPAPARPASPADAKP